MTHELLHILQTDNNKHQSSNPDSKLNLLQEWRDLFGEHEYRTLVHIPLHALHKYIYLDVLNTPERLERDVSESKNSKTGIAYTKAWDYVNERDYRDIVQAIAALYGFREE